MSHEQPPVTVCAYARPTQLLPEVEACLDALRGLERDGVIDALLYEEWPNEVVLSERPPFSPVAAHFARFERWAADAGIEIRPPFDVHERHSVVLDDTRRILVTPVLCLAVFTDERLVSVFPHRDGDDYHTVTDAIDALEAGAWERLGVEAADTRPRAASLAVPGSTGTDRLPHVCVACGGSPIPVQGLVVCGDCLTVSGTPPRTESPLRVR